MRAFFENRPFLQIFNYKFAHFFCKFRPTRGEIPKKNYKGEKSKAWINFNKKTRKLNACTESARKNFVEF